jgi:hypothetical protein
MHGREETIMPSAAGEMEAGQTTTALTAEDAEENILTTEGTKDTEVKKLLSGVLRVPLCPLWF